MTELFPANYLLIIIRAGTGDSRLIGVRARGMRVVNKYAANSQIKLCISRVCFSPHFFPGIPHIRAPSHRSDSAEAFEKKKKEEETKTPILPKVKCLLINQINYSN